MATEHFTSPGKESFWINNREYYCIVKRNIYGAYSARVEDWRGVVIAQSVISWGRVSDAWAWAVGSLSNHISGLLR